MVPPWWKSPDQKAGAGGRLDDQCVYTFFVIKSTVFLSKI